MIGKTAQIALLTAGFGGAYFGMRALPVSNCNFLHTEQTIVTADGLEFCGSGASSFVDVVHLPFPITVNLKADGPVSVGKEAHYTLSLEKDDGTLLRASEFAVTQTRKLHLLLVDPSMEDYQHIHPEPAGETGDWTFNFTPRNPGNYTLYAQFVPDLTLRQMVGKAEINVPGERDHSVDRGLAPYTQDGNVYALGIEGGSIDAGVPATLTLTVHHDDGTPVSLEPVMGSLAHLVAFDRAGNGVAHMHPILAGKEHDPKNPQMSFQVNLTQPGRYRVWSQVKIGGVERFAPFDLTVK